MHIVPPAKALLLLARFKIAQKSLDAPVVGLFKHHVVDEADRSDSEQLDGL